MKRAVSISLGSSARDHKVVINLLGKEVSVERTGTDGDLKKATALYKELDGQVEAFGVGGTDLGVPIPIKGLVNLRRLARILMPVVGCLPMSVIYPTGEKQNDIVPKYVKWYQWASVIAGDFNYIKRHLPYRLDGKVVVTNTTTAADLELLRGKGVRYLVTTTPRFEGRSFGTNVIEAVLTAMAGKGRPLTPEEIQELLVQLDFRPNIAPLN